MESQNKLYAYLCPVCAHVEIVATRRVGAYHKAMSFHGWRQHAMKEIEPPFDAALGLDEIKRRVLEGDYDKGVREIESVSKEIPSGVVRFEKAKVKRWRRAAERRREETGDER